VGNIDPVSSENCEFPGSTAKFWWHVRFTAIFRGRGLDFACPRQRSFHTVFASQSRPTQLFLSAQSVLKIDRRPLVFRTTFLTKQTVPCLSKVHNNFKYLAKIIYNLPSKFVLNYNLSFSYNLLSSYNLCPLAIIYNLYFKVLFK
jgi:hypothetical protein